MPYPPKILILLLALLWLSACTSSAPERSIRGPSAPVDFSGDWELDYSQSDEIQSKLNALVRELRREAERRANMRGDSRGGPSVAVGPSINSGESVINLARMADYITSSQLLDIVQDEHRITVKREESFALNCEFHSAEPLQTENPLGREVCGWDGHQLVFWVILPDGLRVMHRMSLGPEGQRLQIATTVSSSYVSYPFTLNRVYNRYDPESGGIRCKQTLTRGRVCTTERPE